MTYSLAPAQTLREQFLLSLKERDGWRAAKAARGLLQENSRIREWAFIRKEISKVSKGELPAEPLKVAFLSSFSTEFLHSPVIAYGFVNGFDVQIYQAGFSQFRQEILNPQSGLYKFAPDVVILAVEGKDWVPELYSGYLPGIETGSAAAVSSVQAEIELLLQELRKHTRAAVLFHNFCPPVYTDLGIIDARIHTGQSRSISDLNHWVAETCRNIPDTYVLDYAGLAGKVGLLRWYDDRLTHMAQAPISMDATPHLAIEYMKFFRALTGRTKKCIVVDLDNTLWGWVLGEVGAQGIQLGPTYPGSAFAAFQRALLRLYERGTLLAIASKNNSADVDEVFDKNPHMALRKEHFAAVEIHWNPKSDSVRNVADRLNIGLEHIVFADDNPVECDEVSTALPMVRTILLPPQPEKLIHTVFEEGLFDSITYSSEDRRRTQLYRQRAEANSLRSQTGTIEDFYRSLQMTAVFSPVMSSTIGRAAQLTQKTNQFNATTRRYTEADLVERLTDPDWILTTVSVRDRFGDNGIVGVTMAKRTGEALEIDTLLLSCRVIGRSIETAMLAQLRGEAAARGLRELRGRIVPTPKNEPVRDLFARHGFSECGEAGSGGLLWSLSLDNHELREPEWITVEKPHQTKELGT